MSVFLTIAVIHFLALISPGPDFVMVTKNSLSYSRKTGIVTSLGIAFGLGVHSLYCLLGIGLLISQSILLFNIIKYIGAAYLLFIGWKALMSKSKKSTTVETLQTQSDITFFQALSQGFLCNVLNPKATLFMFALFTQIIDVTTPTVIQSMYAIYMSMATFVWFSFLASVFSIPNIKRFFSKAQTTIERVMGVVLIALGLKVALSNR